MKRQLTIVVVFIFIILALSACGKNTTKDHDAANMGHENSNSMTDTGMNHSSSGELPAGIKEEKNPTFKVGTQAVIHADHMVGMNNAIATIVGAYHTTVYAVSYDPTTGGERVNNHKWVVQEEILNAGGKEYKPGDTVVLKADHMAGMKGATATIDTAELTTAYMVDYMPTTGGEMVKNHMWVIESELSEK